MFMFKLTEKLLAAGFTISLLAAPHAEAGAISKKTRTMAKVPDKEKDDVRNAKYQVTSGAGGKIFNNAEGRLPALPPRGDDQYYEFQLGSAQDGSAGKHRLVIECSTKKKNDGTVKYIIESMWYTPDHYGTFIRLRN